MVYGDYDGPGRLKNKANSKPNKANFGATMAFTLMAEEIATAFQASQ